MAAAELTTESAAMPGDALLGKQPKIEDRLMHVAGMSHWRHVFLIAASRCFSETALHYLRSTIVSIPRALDAFEGDRLSCTGARLALEMLVDGIGSNHPISKCKLVEHAMDLLQLGPENFDDRLALIWSGEASSIYEGRLKACLSEGNSPAGLAAWKLLSHLLRSGKSQFEEMARQFWPRDANAVLVLLNSLDFRLPKSLASEAKSAISSISFTRLENSHLRKFISTLAHEPEHPLRFIAVISPNVSHQAGFSLFRDGSPLRVLPTSMESDRLKSFDEDVEGWHESWRIIKRAADLARSGSVEAVSEILKAVSRDGLLTELKSSYAVLPWVLESFLQASSSQDDLEKLSDRILKEEFGDWTAWVRAEDRWKKFGILQSDVTSSAFSFPFPKNIDGVGAPMIRHLSFTHGSRDTSTLVLQIVETIKGLDEKSVFRAQLFFAAIFLLGVSSEAFKLPIQSFLYLFEDKECSQVPDALCLSHIEDIAWDDDSVVSRLEEIIYRSNIFWTAYDELDATPVIRAYKRNPSRRSLLFLIAYWLANKSDDYIKAISDLPESAFQHRACEDWRVAGAVATLRVMKGYEISPETAMCLVPEDEKLSLQRFVDKLFERDLLQLDTQEKLAVLVIQRLLTVRPKQAWWPRPALKKVLDARKSRLDDRAVWVETLRLPSDAFEVLKPHGI